MMKYRRGAVARDAAEQSEIIEHETKRERALRAVGCDVVRLTWSDVVKEGTLAQGVSLPQIIAHRRDAIRQGSAIFRGYIPECGPLITPNILFGKSS